MEAQRTYIIVGLAIVTWLLYNAWQQDYAPNPSQQPPAVTQTIPDGSSLTPDVSTNLPTEDDILPQVAENKPVTGLSDAVKEKLLAYSWPGNIRELRNVIERAVALTRHDKIKIVGQLCRLDPKSC